MKPTLTLLLAGCALATASGVALAQEEGYSHHRPFQGDWTSSEGDLSVDQHEDRISGTYAKRNGRLSGHVDGHQARGIWAQDYADQSCDEARMGTHYWGRFEWRLSDDRQHFYGRYSYCDADPSYSWNGDRR